MLGCAADVLDPIKRLVTIIDPVPFPVSRLWMIVPDRVGIRLELVRKVAAAVKSRAKGVEELNVVTNGSQR